MCGKQCLPVFLFQKLLKNKQNNLSEGFAYKLPEHSNLRGKEEYQ